MDESGGTSPKPAEARQVFDDVAEPGTPLSTDEVATELDCEPAAAATVLETIAENGPVHARQLDSDTRVWWRPADLDESTGSAEDASTESTDDGRSEQQFRALVDAVEEYAIFMMDAEGYVQSWNSGAQQVKGYAEDEIVGEHFSRFYPEDAVEAGVPQRNLATAREQGQVEDEGWRVRKDGEQFWANVTITPIRDDGELRGFAKVTRDMTERHGREQRLREEKERFQRMVEEVRDYAIFMLDPEGQIVTWNRGAARIKGYEKSDVLGEHISLFYPEDYDGGPEALLAQAAAQGRVADEGWRLRADGTRFWASVVITALYDDEGTLRGFAKVTRDLTERKRQERRLAALDELGRTLLQAETPRAVGDAVIEAAVADLDLPVSMIALYDDETGQLQPFCKTPQAEQLQSDVPLFDPASAIPWDVFGNDEPVVVDDLSQQGDASSDDLSVTSAIVVPVGRHGVFVTAFESEDGEAGHGLHEDGENGDGPSDEEVDFVNIVAADLEAALNNTERQQLLRERESTLAERNESLARLNRINDVVRTIDQALIGASTREEIEQAVCSELATSGPYRIAWIGRQDAGAETVTPTARAGIGAEYVDEHAVTTTELPTEGHPAGVAVARRSSVVIEDVRSDPPFEPWRKEALKRGYRSMISVPIVYEDSLYGVLTVLADEPETFAGVEAQVVEELGETVAHAINAIESKHALVSDDFIELEFRIRDQDIPLLQLVAHADCAFELDSVMSHVDGSLSVFFTTRGATPDAVEAFVDQSLGFSTLRHVADGDDGESLFQADVTDESLVATLVDHGGIPQTITAEGEAGRLVVSLPAQADVREFIEMLQTKYPASELTARRTRDRTERTPHEFRAAFEEQITDRQGEVLRTAYFSGFFETPRKCTGQELGEALGVSQPTVNHHLRACQRALLGMLYDDEHRPVAALDR